MLCNACNFLKYTCSMDEARVLLRHIASSSEALDPSFTPLFGSPIDGNPGRTLDAGMHLVFSPPPPILDDERQRNRELATIRWNELKYRAAQRGLEFVLTVGDVEGFFLERRAGKDAFLSADGVVLPMTLASVDRLHDGHGYVPGNIRLILRCHDTLRVGICTALRCCSQSC